MDIFNGKRKLSTPVSIPNPWPFFYSSHMLWNCRWVSSKAFTLFITIRHLSFIFCSKSVPHRACLNLVESESEDHSVISNSLQPHGQYSPWNCPGQNTGVGSLSLLQNIFPTQVSNPGLPHCGQIFSQLSHKGSPEPHWVTSSFCIDKAGLCGLLDPILLSSELILARYMITCQWQKGRTQPEEKRREMASI